MKQFINEFFRFQIKGEQRALQSLKRMPKDVEFKIVHSMADIPGTIYKCYLYTNNHFEYINNVYVAIDSSKSYTAYICSTEANPNCYLFTFFIDDQPFYINLCGIIFFIDYIENERLVSWPFSRGYFKQIINDEVVSLKFIRNAVIRDNVTVWFKLIGPYCLALWCGIDE